MIEAALWDKRYAATERLFPADPDPTLVELATPLAPGKAVDLGAGEGRNSLWLARRGWDVTAVDVSAVGLGRLQAAAAAEGLQVTTVQADITEFLRTGMQFDLVILAYLHPRSSERPAIFTASAAAVAPGGYLFLAGHHLDSLGQAGPSDPDRLYTEEDLRGAFPGLDILRLERRVRRRHSDSVPVFDAVVWASAPKANSVIERGNT